MTERYCSNCRAELPEKADSCPECGVFAGDLFDGKVPREKRPSNRGFWTGILLITCIGAGYAVWLNERPEKPVAKEKPPAVRVVGDRPGGARRAPGAKVSEAEAIRLLRRHFVETRNLKNECLVTMGAGGDRYVFNVFDRCADVRLGRWKVDAKSGDVSRAG